MKVAESALKVSDELLREFRETAEATGKSIEEVAEAFHASALAREPEIRAQARQSREALARAGMTIDLMLLHRYRYGRGE